MSEDWKVGDIAVRLSENCCPGHDLETQTPLVVPGRHYRVVGTRPGPFGPPPECIGTALYLAGISVSVGFCSLGFRRLNDEPEDAELIEWIKKCRPAKLPALQPIMATPVRLSEEVWSPEAWAEIQRIYSTPDPFEEL